MSIAAHIIELKKKHAEVDTAVTELQRRPGICSLAVRKMKKKKLELKEEIVRLESQH